VYVWHIIKMNHASVNLPNPENLTTPSEKESIATILALAKKATLEEDALDDDYLLVGQLSPEEISNRLRKVHHLADEEIACLLLAAGDSARTYALKTWIPNENIDSGAARRGFLGTALNSKNEIVAQAILDNLTDLFVEDFYMREGILEKMMKLATENEALSKRLTLNILNRLETLLPDNDSHNVDYIRSCVLSAALSYCSHKEVWETTVEKAQSLSDSQQCYIIFSAIDKAVDESDVSLALRMVGKINEQRLSDPNFTQPLLANIASQSEAIEARVSFYIKDVQDKAEQGKTRSALMSKGR
jgi:hypothetical protein